MRGTVKSSLKARETVIIVGREGVMKIGDGGDVPREICHGARQEGAYIVNEVDNRFQKLLRELGDWGRTCSRYLLGTSKEQPLNFGYGSVPKVQFVHEKFTCYRSVNITQFLDGTAGDCLWELLIMKM